MINFQNLQDDKSPLYLFVDSTRERLDKNVLLIVSLTSLSRWYDSATGDGAGLFGSQASIAIDKGGRGGGTSTDKLSADVGLARGKRRTSTLDTIPGAQVSLQDGGIAESKSHYSKKKGSICMIY